MKVAIDRLTASILHSEKTRNLVKECKLCGKLEDKNWKRHFQIHHEGIKPIEVRRGEYADSYRFA